MADLITKILLYGDGKLDRVTVPIDDATVIAKGELISYESGKAVKVDAATDDATILGIAEDDHKAGGNTTITVLTKCIVKAPMTSAAYAIGAGLKYKTDGTFEADGGANTCAHAWEDSGGASVTSLKVLIDTVNLAKLFPTSA